MSKIYCISYASNHFLNRKKNFLNEVRAFNEFDDIKIFCENDLDYDFVKKYNNVLNLSRGGGYWIWKPQIIKQYLQNMKNNDILFYVDVGCSFNTNKQAKKNFDWYIDYINQNSFLRFASEYPEKWFSNKKTINFFSKKYKIDYNKLADSKHLIATIMGFIKNNKTINFINEYFSCLEEDCLIITDDYNNIDACDDFKDHRHDQSLFSLLYKSLNYKLAIIDNTWSTNWENCKNIPIISTRYR